VQSFLEFANFYQKFIWNYSKIAEPLIQLTKKKQSFEWEKEQQAVFKKLKQKFCEEPVLKIYNPEKPAILEIDASNYTIRACLSQSDKEGRLHSVIYYSRKITLLKLNYDIYNKELLAIVAALKKWRHYLKKAKHQTLIYCDYKNLVYFTIIKELTQRQAR